MAAKKPAKKLSKKTTPKASSSAKNTGAAQLPLAPNEGVQPVQLQDEMER